MRALVIWKQEGSAAPGLASLKPQSLREGEDPPYWKELRSWPWYSLSLKAAPHCVLLPTDLVLRDKPAPACSGSRRILRQSKTF